MYVKYLVGEGENNKTSDKKPLLIKIKSEIISHY